MSVMDQCISMESLSNDNDIENRSALFALRAVNFSITHLTWTEIKFNSGSLDGRMAINRLSHGMALSVYYQNHVKNAEFLNVKAGGMYSDHWAANG